MENTIITDSQNTTPFQEDANHYSLPASLQDIRIDKSPFADSAEGHTRAWLKSLGLDDNSRATHQLDIYRPGTYAGFMWPHATRKTLNVLSDLTGWFSCQDDLADEDLGRAPEALEQAIRNVHGAASGAADPAHGGLAAGFVDIVRRAGATMPAAWTDRTVEQYGSYLYPCLRAAVHRRERSQPSAQDYETVWRNAGGFQVCIEFTYYATSVHLPSSIYYSPAWQELRCLTLNLLKAVNDLLSFRIMEDPDEDVYNLLTHLRRRQGYSAGEAAVEVSRRIEGWAALFVEVQAGLPDTLQTLGCDKVLQDQVVRCAEALRLQWLGNIGWHLAVPRYREIRFRDV